MSKGRKAIVVNVDDLQTMINLAERDGPLASRGALWGAVAATDLAKLIGLSSQVAYLRYTEWKEKLSVKTPVGQRGRQAGQGMPEALRNAKPKQGKGRKRIPLELVDTVKACFPANLHGKVDKAAAGSLKAAVALKCIDCSGGVLKEVRGCVCTDCPLWGFRPYQG